MTNGTTQGSGYQPWQNAPSFVQIAACQQGGDRGAQLWGLTYSGQLYSIYQLTPGGAWSEWLGPKWNVQPAPFIDIAAAQQNDGRVMVFGLDQRQQTWMCSQNTPGGHWISWTGPNWNGTPQLNTVAASQQGGSRGAQVWGSTQEYALVTSYQETPGGAWSKWSAWPYPNTPQVIELAAAQQNDGRVQLWATTSDGVLISTYQTSPGGNWTNWNQ